MKNTEPQKPITAAAAASAPYRKSDIIEGTTLSQCGAAYYQPYGNQYVVVYVD